MNNLSADIFIDDNHKLGQESKNILNNFILQAPKGWYDVTINRRFKKATHKQFGYVFGFVYDEFLKAVINTGLFEITDPKEIDPLCMAMFAKKDMVNKLTGEVIPIPLSKADFCTLDMMCYVDSIRDFASINMNYLIADPNPNWAQEKARLIKEKAFITKALNDCVSVEELDSLFEKVYEFGMEREFEERYNQLNQ